MAGKKGRSGRKAPELKIKCESTIRTTALPKILSCLKTDGPGSTSWRWAFEQLCKIGGLYAPTEQKLEHSGSLDLSEAARSFESRMARLVARVGSPGGAARAD